MCEVNDLHLLWESLIFVGSLLIMFVGLFGFAWWLTGRD